MIISGSHFESETPHTCILSSLGAAVCPGWAELLAPTHTDETAENPYPAEVVFWSQVANEFTAKTRVTTQVPGSHASGKGVPSKLFRPGFLPA